MDDDNDSVAYIVRMSSRRLYVVYRGTDDTEDLMHDADLFLEPLDPAIAHVKDAKVHRGFQCIYKDLKASVVPRVDAFMTDDDHNNLTFVGFSMGAAVAAIAALAFATKFPGGRVSFVGLGMPRVGNQAWARAFDASVPDAVRVVNGCDCICKVPFGNSYTHVGRDVHVGHTDMHPNIPVLTALVDHKLIAYAKNIDTFVSAGGQAPATPTAVNHIMDILRALFSGKWWW